MAQYRKTQTVDSAAVRKPSRKARQNRLSRRQVTLIRTTDGQAAIGVVDERTTTVERETPTVRYVGAVAFAEPMLSPLSGEPMRGRDGGPVVAPRPYVHIPGSTMMEGERSVATLGRSRLVTDPDKAREHVGNRLRNALPMPQPLALGVEGGDYETGERPPFVLAGIYQTEYVGERLADSLVHQLDRLGLFASISPATPAPVAGLTAVADAVATWCAELASYQEATAQTVSMEWLADNGVHVDDVLGETQRWHTHPMIDPPSWTMLLDTLARTAPRALALGLRMVVADEALSVADRQYRAKVQRGERPIHTERRKLPPVVLALVSDLVRGPLGVDRGLLPLGEPTLPLPARTSGLVRLDDADDVALVEASPLATVPERQPRPDALLPAPLVPTLLERARGISWGLTSPGSRKSLVLGLAPSKSSVYTLGGRLIVVPTRKVSERMAIARGPRPARNPTASVRQATAPTPRVVLLPEHTRITRERPYPASLWHPTPRLSRVPASLADSLVLTRAARMRGMP